jgi:hypothetical protein
MARNKRPFNVHSDPPADPLVPPPAEVVEPEVKALRLLRGTFASALVPNRVFHAGELVSLSDVGPEAFQKMIRSGQFGPAVKED